MQRKQVNEYDTEAYHRKIQRKYFNFQGDLQKQSFLEHYRKQFETNEFWWSNAIHTHPQIASQFRKQNKKLGREMFVQALRYANSDAKQILDTAHRNMSSANGQSIAPSMMAKFAMDNSRNGHTWFRYKLHLNAEQNSQRMLKRLTEWATTIESAQEPRPPHPTQRQHNAHRVFNLQRTQQQLAERRQIKHHQIAVHEHMFHDDENFSFGDDADFDYY